MIFNFGSVSQIGRGVVSRIVLIAALIGLTGSGIAPAAEPAGSPISSDDQAPHPPGSGLQAGKVSSAIPEEVVQPRGKNYDTPLKLGDGVEWQDIVRTLNTGRVRIEL